MIILGHSFLKGRYPKKINCLLGYRKDLSVKNQAVWEFAQKQMGKIWFITGAIIVLPSVVPMLFVIGGEPGNIGGMGGCIAIAQIFIMAAVSIPIDNAIKKKFPGIESKKSQ